MKAYPKRCDASSFFSGVADLGYNLWIKSCKEVAWSMRQDVKPVLRTGCNHKERSLVSGYGLKQQQRVKGKEESRQRKPPTAGFKPHAPRDDAASPTGGLSWQRLGAGAREGGRGLSSKIIGHSGNCTCKSLWCPLSVCGNSSDGNAIAYRDGILGTCIWLDGHDSWHQEGKIQPNSNAGHVWGSSRKFLWVESMGTITMNSVHQDMGSVKWLGSLLATSHWKQLFHHHDCSKLGVLSVCSQHRSQHERPLLPDWAVRIMRNPRTLCQTSYKTLHRSVATGRKEPGQMT
nr:PREDICTED: uncharacterized protein LOC108953789 [Musa acuminata subsp. malaccensis]